MPYKPSSKTLRNIVPCLFFYNDTATTEIYTALSVTREVERGTMESLLSMPIKPLEIMLGKIAPYIFIGFLQALIILGAGTYFFHVPIVGSLTLLALLTTLFITANLAVGYTFSTLARTQLQAMQMSMMWFLPNILLSGFMFPFAGMPGWAQWLGEVLPLTHYLRIVRGVMLKGANLYDLSNEALWLIGLTLIAMTIAVTRFRRTLD
jgi:ABC-2 type transport system permease protein